MQVNFEHKAMESCMEWSPLDRLDNISYLISDFVVDLRHFETTHLKGGLCGRPASYYLLLRQWMSYDDDVDSRQKSVSLLQNFEKLTVMYIKTNQSAVEIFWIYYPVVIVSLWKPFISVVRAVIRLQGGGRRLIQLWASNYGRLVPGRRRPCRI